MVENQQAKYLSGNTGDRPGWSPAAWADGSGWLHSQVGDQWNLHWSRTCVYSQPEPSADPPGVYLYLPVTGSRPAFCPPLLFAPSLMSDVKGL